VVRGAPERTNESGQSEYVQNGAPWKGKKNEGHPDCRNAKKKKAVRGVPSQKGKRERGPGWEVTKKKRRGGKPRESGKRRLKLQSAATHKTTQDWPSWAENLKKGRAGGNTKIADPSLGTKRGGKLAWEEHVPRAGGNVRLPFVVNQQRGKEREPSSRRTRLCVSTANKGKTWKPENESPKRSLGTEQKKTDCAGAHQPVSARKEPPRGAKRQGWPEPGGRREDGCITLARRKTREKKIWGKAG